MNNKKKILILIVSVSLLFACDSAEESKEKYIQQGKTLLEDGRIDKALLAFKNALQIAPKDTEGHYQLAEAYSKKGKLKKAFAHYREIMAIDEKHVMSRIRTGQLFLLARNVEVAEKLMKEAAALSPDNVEVLILRAGIYSVKNNDEMAVASIEKVLKQEPGKLPAIVMLASIHAKMGEYDKAIKVLKNPKTISPDNESKHLESIHLLLAKIYTKKQLKEEVENELKILIEINPDSLEHYKRLVLFYLDGKQNKKAEMILRNAVTQLNDNVAAQLLLIDFLVSNEGLDKAKDELLSLINQKPDVFLFRFKLFALHLKNKDSVAAEATLNKVIELDSLGSAGLKARNMLARYYVKTKRINKAKELIHFVLKENPRDSASLMLRGRLSLSEKKILDAITDFRAVLVGQPENTQVLSLLASAQVENKDIVLAIENFEKVIAYAPKDVGAKERIIDLLMHSKKTVQAELHIKALLKLEVDNKKALDNLFKIHAIRKEWDKAQQIAKKYQNDINNKAQGYFMSGVAYQLEGKVDSSIIAFKQALSLNPDAVKPLTQIVKSFLAQKQADKAILYLKELITADQNNFMASNLLGELYAHENNLVLAEKAFRQSIAIKPDGFNSYLSLAALFLKEKNISSAKEVLINGLEKTNGSAQLLSTLAIVYLKEGRYDDLIQLYEEAYKKHPESKLIVNNLASYITEYQATESNLARLEKMLVDFEDSNNPMMIDTAAWVSYKQGNYTKAQKLLERAVRVGSVTPEISYHLGMVFYKQGDVQSAQIHLQKALSSDVDFMNIEHARNVLNEIKGG